MSPSVRRWHTQHVLKQRIARFTEYHPATFAAYGRAFIAWDGRIRPPRCKNVDHVPLAAAYTTAQLRAYGNAGANNRAARKARARRFREHEGTDAR